MGHIRFFIGTHRLLTFITVRCTFKPGKRNHFHKYFGALPLLALPRTNDMPMGTPYRNLVWIL